MVFQSLGVEAISLLLRPDRPTDMERNPYVAGVPLGRQTTRNLSPASRYPSAPEAADYLRLEPNSGLTRG